MTTTPMTATPHARPLLQTIVDLAVEATGARTGWLAAVVPTTEPGGTELAVVAASSADPDLPGRLLWQRSPIGAGTASLVIQSSQPVALSQQSGSADVWATALLGRAPATLVCVPCLAGERAVGALELVDRDDGAPFGFDDVELVTLLGLVAGEAIAEGPLVAPA